ncbi:MAG: prephenate dehydratase domain-containing protein [Candidatus Neomarinimicrobiota bacterium]|jgi:prephenate dehydratase|nr:prephenate dehydratase domain-containing protein [Candidatus Neomarinimicrobiota bacterium]|tara:strand:+ start:701 stop:1276 length:576 start_codon:yes stop_codon:yes gene_type:complete
MKKVGIQGLEGSFSEQAAKFYCNKFDIQDFELAYLVSSMNVLNGLNSNEIDVGIFAMENAQGGVVIESVKALAENNCKIIDMFYVEISQNLMAKDSISLGEIEEIHSHEQALKQCKDYLAEKFWSKKLVETDDTAKSAQDLASGKLGDNVAVIASKQSAEKYGLNIVDHDIHDLKKNLTLFLAVERLDKNE